MSRVFFGAEAAAHHAAAAGDAGSSLGAFSPEEWIRKNLIARFSRLGLEDAYFRAIKSMPATCSFSSVLQEMVGRSKNRVLGDSQHPRGSFIVTRHLRSPIGQSRPRAGFPYFFRRRKQSTSVGDGSATHGTTMKNSHMLEIQMS